MPQIQQMRVLLADDHALVRAGIRALLEKLPGVSVVGEAGTGRETLRMIKERQPDLLLLDLTMSELGGLEVIHRVARDYPKVKVMVLSMHADEEYVLHALRAGACGYLVKEAAATELKLALQSAAAGKTYLSRAVSRHVSASRVERLGTSSRLDRLSSRQREVLQLLAEGRTTKEIAFDLGISAKTVETHRAQIMHRLDIHDVPGLVRYALRAGLVKP